MKANAGAIGFVALQTAGKFSGSNAKPLSVDGVTASNTAAASGQYSYTAEAYSYRANGLSANQVTLAQHFITALSKSTTAPAGNAAVSLFAVPSGANPPTFPLTTGNVPIGVGTTGGSVCSNAVSQL